MSSRILLVDDEPKILRGLRRVLSDDQSAWDVSTAGGADEALVRMRQIDFDAVVTDANMPGRDGFALLADFEAIHSEFSDPAGRAVEAECPS